MGITSIGSGDTVWVQVELTGTTLVVKRIKSSTAPSDSDWASATDVYTYTGLSRIGGQFGFSANYGKVDIDNLTIKSDPDNDGSFSTTELVETFTLDSGGYDEGIRELGIGGGGAQGRTLARAVADGGLLWRGSGFMRD